MKKLINIISKVSIGVALFLLFISIIGFIFGNEIEQMTAPIYFFAAYSFGMTGLFLIISNKVLELLEQIKGE